MAAVSHAVMRTHSDCRTAPDQIMTTARITLIGGPTALIELDGFRFLTDPTFDDPGEYKLPHVTLRKTKKPALRPEQLGAIDAVLLSHDQHADNLDNSGRALLSNMPRVFTTVAAAGRLGGSAIGLQPWEMHVISKGLGNSVQITATPARHGPQGIEPLSGDVVGFVISSKSNAFKPLYVTGDTVWFHGVAEVYLRFKPRLVLLFAGAAQTRGRFNLTMNANDAIELAATFPEALIVPLHNDGWAHFTESADDLEQAFNALGHGHRLRRLKPGEPMAFEL
jgi:L-ascorbate metabolism protein UlaG (beta-lactamase superfamily)